MSTLKAAKEIEMKIREEFIPEIICNLETSSYKLDNERSTAVLISETNSYIFCVDVYQGEKYILLLNKDFFNTWDKDLTTSPSIRNQISEFIQNSNISSLTRNQINKFIEEAAIVYRKWEKKIKESLWNMDNNQMFEDKIKTAFLPEIMQGFSYLFSHPSEAKSIFVLDCGYIRLLISLSKKDYTLNLKVQSMHEEKIQLRSLDEISYHIGRMANLFRELEKKKN